jgi:UDP-N-acetylglucosamine diphosphorylase / glucose-1-phosphate thymidylyltransferase / UDP-N-acetylgalactosamine diphosphorylase / glucosamine-1-phosphate N-acetyltransferase / galactosamine-1-phosphate N-acetyltransferase
MLLVKLKRMSKMIPNNLKTIILAGGESSRLWPLREKSMIRFFDKPLLEHQLDALINLGLNDIIVICNSSNRQVINESLQKYNNQITFQTCIQERPLGMGDALLSLSSLLEDEEKPLPALILQVHDVVDISLYSDLLSNYNNDPETTWLSAKEVDKYFDGGYLIIKDGYITGIIEKPGRGNEPSNLVNLVIHLHPDLRRLLDAIKDEYTTGITTDDHYERAMNNLMAKFPFRPVPYSKKWWPIKYPWHVLDLMQENYLKNLNVQMDSVNNFIDDSAVIATDPKNISGLVQISKGVNIENDVVIKGPVQINENVFIEAGTYIVGPAIIGKGVRISHNADIRGPVYIGDNSRIYQLSNVRESMISSNCIIGFNSEVNRSYVGRYTEMHSGTLLDTVVADSTNKKKPTNISKFACTYNYRSDRGEVSSVIKGKKVFTERTKFGAIIGSGAFISGGALIMPGVKIGENAIVGPSTTVLEDVADNTKLYNKQEFVKREII